MRIVKPLVLALSLGVTLPSGGYAQDVPPLEPPQRADAMTLGSLAAILRAIDPSVQVDGTHFQLAINDAAILVIADPLADRMRALVRIGPADAMDEAMMMRLLQANFDAVLDARYAVAGGQIWSAYIHPLSPLEPSELVSGLAQMVNAAQSFGTGFTGGGVQFGGGDSNELQQELMEGLRKKGLPL
ncbi:hypothetical protein O2N63_15640 [Aliiroseovarius sp. KMU-50]|uniref:YbjN domain-containing protein n=1 Tax=Aliiroseovarius salicola TaxID=3009082 RepID=A0ABT4W6J3_9RHOB|nr:hypothetical protein [Aliiroseovarius sp. KMU-50]MDA5095522.1 hypothetical protein [Aliiroseovarius sp. KMU-50]